MWVAFSSPCSLTRGYHFRAQAAQQRDKLLLLPQAAIPGPGLPFLRASLKLHEARGPAAAGGEGLWGASLLQPTERGVHGSRLKELEPQAEPRTHCPGTARPQPRAERLQPPPDFILEGAAARWLDLMAQKKKKRRFSAFLARVGSSTSEDPIQRTDVGTLLGTPSRLHLLPPQSRDTCPGITIGNTRVNSVKYFKRRWNPARHHFISALVKSLAYKGKMNLKGLLPLSLEKRKNQSHTQPSHLHCLGTSPSTEDYKYGSGSQLVRKQDGEGDSSL